MLSLEKLPPCPSVTLHTQKALSFLSALKCGMTVQCFKFKGKKYFHILCRYARTQMDSDSEPSRCDFGLDNIFVVYDVPMQSMQDHLKAVV